MVAVCNYDHFFAKRRPGGIVRTFQQPAALPGGQCRSKSTPVTAQPSGEPAPGAVDTFDTLFRDYAQFVWRTLGRLGVPRKDLSDASQEVFLVVYRKLGDFEGRSSVKTWIYGISVRVASAWRRKASHLREEMRPDAPEQATHPSQDGDLERRQARERLMQALALLDDEKRAVFVLYELEELSMPQVAESLGCPLTTAYSRLHAARKAVRAAFLRQGLSDRGGPQ